VSATTGWLSGVESAFAGAGDGRLEYIDELSYETVRRVLKENEWKIS